MGICSGISTKWLFIHCSQIEQEFRSVDFFCGGRKTGEPAENDNELMIINLYIALKLYKKNIQKRFSLKVN